MASRFDHQDTAGPGNGLPDLHFAPAVSFWTWVLSPVELFADLQSLRPRVPRFQDFSRIAYPLTGDTDALGCGTGSTLSSRPRVGLAPTFVCGQGDSGRPETRFRVAQSRLWKAPDWVESGVVSPGSARCNRTSPITGIRLRAMRLVTVGSGHEKDVYRRSGCVGAHPCLRKIWRQCRDVAASGSRYVFLGDLHSIGTGCADSVSFRETGLALLGISCSVLRTCMCSPKAHRAFGACLRPAVVSLDSPREIGPLLLRKQCLYFLSTIRQETASCSISPHQSLPVPHRSASRAARPPPCACCSRRSSGAPDTGREVSCRRPRRCTFRRNLPSATELRPAPLRAPATRHEASATPH